MDDEIIRGLYILLLNFEKMRYDIPLIMNSLANAWCSYIFDGAEFQNKFKDMQKVPELGLDLDGWYFLPNLLSLFQIMSIMETLKHIEAKKEVKEEINKEIKKEENNN
jgi:hypothetical protein